MPTLIKDVPNGHLALPAGLEPVMQLAPSWQAAAGKYLRRFGWEMCGMQPNGLPLWDDPMAGVVLKDFEIIKLPRNDDSGITDIVKQACVPPADFPSSTLDAVRVQHNRVRAHGKGVEAELSCAVEMRDAIDRHIKKLTALAEKQGANPPPAAVPAPPVPPKPPAEYVEVKTLPATAVVVQQLSWPVFRIDGSCRSMFVLVEAAAAPGLVEKLKLTPAELFAPPSGALAGKPCVVLGEATPVGPGERGGLLYGPEPQYEAHAAADLCRLFSRPKQVSDQEALRKAGAEATRKAKLEEDLRRQDRQKADQAAAEAARLKADPRAQLKEMRERLEKLEAERQQQAAEEAAALRARLEQMEAERRKKEPPP
jgi:hypothetical protein